MAKPAIAHRTTRGRTETLRHAAIQWLNVGEDLVLVGVAIVLLVAGLAVVLDAVHEVIVGLGSQTMAEGIVGIAENALLALILAELVHTLLVSLGGGALKVEPFLVVAIVAILRKMLLVTVVTPKAVDPTELVSPATVELLALGVLILLLGGVLALLQRTRSGG